MRAFIRAIFIVQLSILLLSNIPFGQGATRSRSKKKASKESKESKELNICDIEEQDAPFFCYCNNLEIGKAVEANCIIFNKVEILDPIWGHFGSQLYIRKLYFVIKHEGVINYVPSQTLRQLKDLNVVSFQQAKFENLESQSFSNMPSVSEINLSKNSIVILKYRAFDTMKNLTAINLDENMLTEINRDVFFDLPKLQKLFMNHNNITIIHDKAFKHLPTLLELELSNNKIAVITGDSFHGLKSLQRLDLRSNLISMIGDRSFIEMPELVELLLDQNKIEYITTKALENMRNLRKLRLSDNKLVSFEPDFLRGAPSINLLDLRDNKLHTLTFDNVKPIIDNFYNNSSYFYIDGNKLICDCRLAWIWSLRNDTRNIKLKEGLEELTCFLETTNASKLDEEAERNSALEIARKTNDYMIKEDSNYMDDDYKEYEEDDAIIVGQSRVIDGKRGYMKYLLDLKLEDLPCPKPSRDELMASEQPSRHRENAAIGSSSSIFSLSSGMIPTASRSVLVLAFVLLVVSRCIFT